MEHGPQVEQQQKGVEHDPQVEQQQQQQKGRAAAEEQVASGGEPTGPGEVPSPAFPLQMQGGSDLATAPPTEWTVELLRSAFLESVNDKEQSYGEAVNSLIDGDEIIGLFAPPEIIELRMGPEFLRMPLFQADVSALSVPGVGAAALRTALARARCDPQRFRLNVTALGDTFAPGRYCCYHSGIRFEFRGHRQNGSGLERIFNVEYDPVSRLNLKPRTSVKDVLDHLNQSFVHHGVQLPVDALLDGKTKDLVKCDDEDYDLVGNMLCTYSVNM